LVELVHLKGAFTWGPILWHLFFLEFSQIETVLNSNTWNTSRNMFCIFRQKGVYHTLKTCCKSLFYFPWNAIYSVISLISVQIILINRALKFKYQPGHLKVNIQHFCCICITMCKFFFYVALNFCICVLHYFNICRWNLAYSISVVSLLPSLCFVYVYFKAHFL